MRGGLRGKGCMLRRGRGWESEFRFVFAHDLHSLISVNTSINVQC